MSAVLRLAPGVDNYCVMGDPVAHSKSPRIHAAFALQTAQNIAYTAVRVPADGFASGVEEFRRLGGKGVNVTLPFKHVAWRLCARRGERAERAGAVNTLWFDEAIGICGDNTDGAGLVRDITVNLGGAVSGTDILLLGAGGAARGVMPALLAGSPRTVTIANRTPERAAGLREVFADLGRVRASGFKDLAGQSFDLIINATSASLEGSVPPLPDGILRHDSWCYDMMYADAPTAFVRWGWAHGAARSVDGLGMLVEQAAESFFIWRGIRPETSPVIASLRPRNA